jgi:PHD/YefM family antitoxin component YafN of YafNO toxin-antitoxin module
VAATVTIPAEEYESMKETLEVLRDRTLVRSLLRGLEDIRRGRTVPHAVVRRKILGR